MKVIKQLRHQTPEYRFRHFFKQMALITRIFLSITLISTIVLLIVGASHSFNFYSYFDARPFSETILFTFVALTDFQRWEKQGSIYFFFSYFFKISILALLKYIIENAILGYTSQEIREDSFFVSTSYPMLYCLINAFWEMIEKPSEIRYFLIDPFQIKCLFYPIFLTILLEIFGWRFDFMYAIVIALLAKVCKKADQKIKKICQKIDKKILSEKMVEKGLRMTDCTETNGSQISNVVTSNSIVLQQS